MRLLRTASIILAAAAHASAWAFTVLTIRQIREDSRFTTDELNWFSETALASPIVFTLIVLACVGRGRHSGWAVAATALTAALALLSGASFGLFLWPVVILMGAALALMLDIQTPKAG